MSLYPDHQLNEKSQIILRYGFFAIIYHASYRGLNDFTDIRATEHRITDYTNVK